MIVSSVPSPEEAGMRRKRPIWSSIVVVTLAMVLGIVAPPADAASLIGSFDPTNLGNLCGVGFNPVSGNVYVQACSTTTINIFTPTGTPVTSFTRPGAASNDIDLDFSLAPLVFPGPIGPITVPSGSLLVSNGDDGNSLRALNPLTGTQIAMTTIAGGTVVGGSHSLARNTMFEVHWVADVITENGTSTTPATQTQSFPVSPTLSPAFDVFFGDVEVSAATGNLLVVSSSQNRIRELTPIGAFVQDIDVSSLNVNGMSGIGCNDAAGEAFISSTNGTVYRLGGVCAQSVGGPVPEPTTLLLLGGGLLGMGAVRRLTKRR